VNPGNVEVDLTMWNRAIPELARIANRDPVIELQLQSKLLIRQIMDFTPPKTMGQGRKAIKEDLSRVFIGFDDDDQDFQNLQGERVIRTFVDKKGYVYGQDVQLYRPEAGTGEMQQHHRSMRSPVTGRVTKTGTRTRDIGRWKFVDKMHVPQWALVMFVLEQQKRVGTTKAGWVPALDHFAALTNATASVPRWIRSQTTKSGSFGGRVTPMGQGGIESTNQVPWIGRAMTHNLIEYITRTRSRDMQGHLEKRMPRIVERFNRGRLAAA
jgi:hypothetical protein